MQTKFQRLVSNITRNTHFLVSYVCIKEWTEQLSIMILYIYHGYYEENDEIFAKKIFNFT